MVESQNLYQKQELFSLVPPNNTDFLRPDANYTVYEIDWEDMTNAMGNFFNTTLFTDGAISLNPSTYPGIQSSLLLYNSQNISQSMDAMAESMTNRIRTSRGATRVPGRAFRTESYIHVRWPWITLPISTVVLSLIFLGVVLIAYRRQNIVPWKSSVLPLLIGRLPTDHTGYLRSLHTVDEVQEESRKVKLKTEVRGNCPDYL
jgi:hypothetical protein